MSRGMEHAGAEESEAGAATQAVANALKYAFPDDQAGTVWVRFVHDGGDFVLTVADDGVGPSRASDAKGPTGTTGGRPGRKGCVANFAADRE